MSDFGLLAVGVLTTGHPLASIPAPPTQPGNLPMRVTKSWAAQLSQGVPTAEIATPELSQPDWSPQWRNTSVAATMPATVHIYQFTPKSNGEMVRPEPTSSAAMSVTAAENLHIETIVKQRELVGTQGTPTLDKSARVVSYVATAGSSVRVEPEVTSTFAESVTAAENLYVETILN